MKEIDMPGIKYTRLPYFGSPIKVEGTHLSFTLQPGRALDISSLFYDGVGIGYNAPDKAEDVTSVPYRIGEFPKHMALGLLTTCGLENAGPEEIDDDGVLWLKHGSMTFNNAGNTTVVENDGKLVISGEIIGNRYHKHHFNLYRSITFCDSENSIEIEDRILNPGERDQICLLYHYNIGSPFLSPSCRVELDADEILSADSAAERNIRNILRVDAPGEREPEVFYTDSPYARISNPDFGLTLTFEKSCDTLPALDIWKNFRPERYVMSFEPANAYPYGRLMQRKKGNACFIEGCAEVTYRTKVVLSSMEL